MGRIWFPISGRRPEIGNFLAGRLGRKSRIHSDCLSADDVSWVTRKSFCSSTMSDTLADSNRTVVFLAEALVEQKPLELKVAEGQEMEDKSS